MARYFVWMVTLFCLHTTALHLDDFGQTGPQVSRPDAADKSKTSLDEMPIVDRNHRGPNMIDHRVKRLRISKRGINPPDPVVQSTSSHEFGIGENPAPQIPDEKPIHEIPASSGFEGIGGDVYPVPGVPADTTGAAGQKQYVQWVNEALAVFDKDSHQMRGPFEGRSLWKGFPSQKAGVKHPCELYNDGDPIVEYDRLTDRWLLAQFAVTNGPPYYECIAVSQSSNALGSYYRYAYKFDKFNDYPKFSVWPDAFYASFNMFEPNSDTPAGGKICAFNKAKMETGDATAEMLCFDTAAGGLLPADFDGPFDRLPPPGDYFLGFVGNDSLRLWQLTPQWNAAVGPTAVLSAPRNIPVPFFTVACGDVESCIPQRDSRQPLESLGDRLLSRLVYRRFATHESLVALHAVQVPSADGNGRTGLRWYELRDLDKDNPIVFQKSTYAPDDGLSRWMGSAAIDKMGNIVVGYSVSGNTIFPSIRYAGRLVSDPPSTLSTEVTAFDGGGSQGVDRWGDYASISLDPKDECTFWFTTEYLQTSGQFNWHTYVTRIRFPTCQ